MNKSKLPFISLLLLNLSISHASQEMSATHRIQVTTTNFDRARDWVGKEHLELGDIGAIAACEDQGLTPRDCPINEIMRRDGQVSFSYGDLVTSGDFYNTPQELFVDRGRGIKNMIRCVHESAKKEEPEQCEGQNFASRAVYATVVSHNYNHFGWNNLVTYVKLHSDALQQAHKAFVLQTLNTQQSRFHWNQALIINGFADHYLTDAFASGHIRIPRLQIKAWGQRSLRGGLKGQRADILSMILHDFESRNIRSGREAGLPVRNSLGQVWRTRSDNHLRESRDPQDQTYILPLRAVADSFGELLDARLHGELPESVFKATWLVPFHQDVSLIEKLTPEYQQMRMSAMIDAIYSIYPFFQQLIFSKSDFHSLLNNLKSIFETFRLAISKELVEKSELRERLPTPYLEAYQQVD
jgi:hypothetical protein